LLSNLLLEGGNALLKFASGLFVLLFELLELLLQLVGLLRMRRPDAEGHHHNTKARPNKRQFPMSA
jgi:hypothetical protein